MEARLLPLAQKHSTKPAIAMCVSTSTVHRPKLATALSLLIAASFALVPAAGANDADKTGEKGTGSGQKIESIGRKDVVQAEDTDKEMNAAMKKARDTLLTFFKALEKRDENKRYLLKVRIEEDGEVEHVWLEPVKREKAGIIGMLANKPVTIKKYKLGDIIAPLPKEISDWAVLSRDGTYEGGFTIKLMEKRVKEQEQKKQQTDGKSKPDSKPQPKR